MFINIELLAEGPLFNVNPPKTCCNLPNSVPPSSKTMSPPSASRLMSPPTSTVKSPASEIVEPLIVISSTVRVVRVPRLVTFV